MPHTVVGSNLFTYLPNYSACHFSSIGRSSNVIKKKKKKRQKENHISEHLKSSISQML